MVPHCRRRDHQLSSPTRDRASLQCQAAVDHEAQCLHRQHPRGKICDRQAIVIYCINILPRIRRPVRNRSMRELNRSSVGEETPLAHEIVKSFAFYSKQSKHNHKQAIKSNKQAIKHTNNQNKNRNRNRNTNTNTNTNTNRNTNSVAILFARRR